MLDIPTTNSSSSVADWVELHIATGGKTLSRTSLRTVLESASGEEPSEAFISDVWRVLSDRERLYIKSPFSVQPRTVSSHLNWKTRPEYIACLIWSLYGNSEESGKVGKFFERISCVAFKNYLSGKAFVFGWPTETGAAVPICEKVKNLAASLHERFVESPANRYNDRGVDVVAWKCFGDQRTSQMIILAQCAAGDNWRTKTRDVSIPAWSEYIHWATTPIMGFSVPAIINANLWHDISKEAGLVLDRARIYCLFAPTTEDPKLRVELTTWCETRISQINN